MSLRDFFLHNWRWKLFSVLLAAAVWFYIRTSIRGDFGLPRLKPAGITTADFVHEFPVTRLTDPADTNQYRIEPATAQVTVRGDFLLMQELHWDEFRVFVDLTRPPEKNTSAHLIRVTPPAGIEVISVEPPAALVRRGPLNGTQPASP
jgi:YbbR domain-containing protein